MTHDLFELLEEDGIQTHILCGAVPNQQKPTGS